LLHPGKSTKELVIAIAFGVTGSSWIAIAMVGLYALYVVFDGPQGLGILVDQTI